MTKAEVIKNWKPALKSLGFTYQKGVFYLGSAKEDFLQFLISIQKNLYSDTYKINPSIVLRSPFEPNSEQRLLILANLRANGVFLHVSNASWWPVDSLTEALETLKNNVTSWFQEWGRPQRLAEIFERAIREEKNIIDIAEPLPAEATQVPWRQEAPAKRPAPPMYYEYASILHYLSHDTSRSLARTRDWIRSLGPDEEALIKKAQHQLSILEKEM